MLPMTSRTDLWALVWPRPAHPPAARGAAGTFASCCFVWPFLASVVLSVA